MNRSLLKTLKAVSDPNRLKILGLLLHEPLYVCEICQLLNLALSTTSKHLCILSNAGLICDCKEGRWIKYTINDQPGNNYPQAVLKMVKSYLLNDDEIDQCIHKLAKHRPPEKC